MKKKEFIFIGGILILALAMWGGMSLINKGSHGSIRITVDGKEYGTYSLEKDQTIKIKNWHFFLLTVKMYSWNLFVLDFARRFFVSCAQIFEAYAVRTLIKFGCS